MIIVFELMTMHSGAAKINWDEFGAALTVPGHRSGNSFFAADDGNWFSSWYSVLSHELSSNNAA
jgi:hypothetical protein